MGRKGKELDTSVRRMVVKAYKENRNTSELERILGIPMSTIRSIVKKFDETGQVENRRGRGRKKVFTDRDKNKLSRVVKENKRRTYEDITGIINEGNNHRFCSRTIKRKFKSWDTNGGLPKKSLFARPTKKLAASGARREEIGLLIVNGMNGCLVKKAR
ncbi:uncharacterized protein LOC133177281 [Saccostrea echinata]|uniref:uncharacterized protein LOC133177281 n=1 Tax=Saccostrea echinata TaxID=191078 RepID=UPI002A7F1F70|nr:uncharacterized protein LOC133177281 [Saccostrea echinata]